MYVFCTFLILVLLILIALMTNRNSNCDDNTNINDNDIDSFITNWLNATTLRNPKKPFDFFSNDAVLFATLSGKFRDTPDEILDYFQMFVNLPNLKNSLVKKLIKKLDKNTWGYYAYVNWSWTGQATDTARMTFIIKANSNNRLRIKLLHSSLIPA